MIVIRWKNQYPPTLPQGGYERLMNPNSATLGNGIQEWKPISVEAVRKLQGGLVLWNPEVL